MKAAWQHSTTTQKTSTWIFTVGENIKSHTWRYSWKQLKKIPFMMATSQWILSAFMCMDFVQCVCSRKNSSLSSCCSWHEEWL